jgi:hypothetical protein
MDRHDERRWYGAERQWGGEAGDYHRKVPLHEDRSSVKLELVRFSWKSAASKSLGERVARQVTGLFTEVTEVTETLASYIEPPSDKALGESLLGE